MYHGGLSLLFLLNLCPLHCICTSSHAAVIASDPSYAAVIASDPSLPFGS
uniref:Uncharacterized protein n=1 Tax=Arundo donax TaxID=35708 RepID=A0A0A9HIE9_ARUDO